MGAAGKTGVLVCGTIWTENVVRTQGSDCSASSLCCVHAMLSLWSQACVNKLIHQHLIRCIVTYMRTENKLEYIHKDIALLILIIKTKNKHKAAPACVAPWVLLKEQFSSLCSAPSHRRGFWTPRPSLAAKDQERWALCNVAVLHLSLPGNDFVVLAACCTFCTSSPASLSPHLELRT